MMEQLLVASTLIKVLLVPAYRSTDFEVHRNWLAITYSLPLGKWYTENTSIWTLDYPPFFAWFEKFWSMFGQYADAEMLRVDNLEYASSETILFQRFTVIASDLVLWWALVRYVKYFGASKVGDYVRYLVAGSILLHPGLLIVDHMHFQYNGFLYGILVLSLVEAKRGNRLISGILFAALLNFKHIFLYMAPAYFVYLLKAHCFINVSEESAPPTFSPKNFLILGGSVAGVFVVSLGPFLHQLPALIGRLFPFTRGLCHAYWAPNFWALYAGADRFLIHAAKKFGWSMNEAALGSMTRGFVGDTVFAVLPEVRAIHTLILTVVAQFAVLQLLWRKPTFENFLSSVTLCGFASFMFGWHVHEKAILIVLIPYSLMATRSKLHFRAFTILSSAGIYSLFPLLFDSAETPIKIGVSLLWWLVVISGLAQCLNRPLMGLHPIEMVYLAGLPGLQVYTGVLHEWIWGGGTLEFLPLLLTSVYCGVGVLYGYILTIIVSLGSSPRSSGT